ncbi:MAG TPA: biotin--[acetyl-CoA-carboxylase] ligase [Dehalococcoidia bacterium]|nr:biotin--[acetyl-CoA-carboxylase] ligase [Dehalococcoidia bacterium]
MTDLSADVIARRLTSQSFGRPVYYYDEIGSTMPEALARARAGDPEGALVIADAQTAGRGRLGRSWLSEGGVNLTFSLVLRPTLDQVRGLPIIAGLAGARAVRAVTGLPAEIKWPNDLVIGDRKFSGILIDAELQGAAVKHVIYGQGINVNQDVSRFPEIAGTATSLAAEAGRPIDRVELLVRVLAELEDAYDRLRSEPPPLTEWMNLSASIGRRVEARSAGGVEIGWAEAVDAEGALLLRRGDGRLVRLISGEVTLRPVTW